LPNSVVLPNEMDIHSALLDVHSKDQAVKISEYIGDDKERFAELAYLFLDGDCRTMQCACWPLSHCVERNPALAYPYLERLVDMLPRKDVHDAVRRNTARMLQYVDIPEPMQGKVYDLCVERVDDPSEPVAVRVFAMAVAARIARDEPDLIGELKLIVEKHMPHTTAAFHSRARKILCI
jgi:hypothetical protein